ncbi:MAG: imidazolonepropionase-like amidohydrolase [Planctomycetota bacterium]|jgi:imidazolonepropionase-like amidohydrolase
MSSSTTSRFGPRRLGVGALAAATAVALWAPSSQATNTVAPTDHGLVAVSAGTIHLVEGGVVLEGGATILIKDGKIQAIGADVKIPAGAKVVDYGPNAVIVPGFVSATGYTGARGTARTAEPGLLGIEDFDFAANRASYLTSGVTSIYVSASENRLIGGQGAMVKLAGDDAAQRTLAAAATVQGAIDGSARNTPGFWEPPIPATVDSGLGYQVPQLPNTTMGAILALEELVNEARNGGSSDSAYGPYAAAELAKAMEAGLPWRIAASTPAEIRALISFGQASGVKVVLDRATGAGPLAGEIATAGMDVIWRFPSRPAPGGGRDMGKGENASWFDYSVPAALEKAGVRFAIAPTTGRDILFSVAAASVGGLSEAAALRSITLSPAEILGVADRVGSIKVGKDADLVVLNAAPLSGQASVLGTWVMGHKAWAPGAPASDKSASTAVVVSVEELHVGDGQVMRNAELLMVDGKIREVGTRVSRPLGATVVSAHSAMPGIVDGMGHLGLEGSQRSVSVDYSLSQIVGPGDEVDRRVANAGVTTVVLATRGVGRGGSPLMAYKPASSDLDSQIIADPTAVRVNWTDRNRANSGAELRELLTKATDYLTKWAEYEQALASWTPPPPAAEEDGDEEEADEEKEEEEEEEAADDDKKKKKKKKGEEELEPDPITGVWTAQVDASEGEEGQRLRMRLHLVPELGSGDMEGNLRSDPVSSSLVELSGSWDREAKSLTLMGLGSGGWVSLVLTLEEGKLTGTCNSGGQEFTISAERTSKEWVVASRSQEVAEEEPSVAAPKGKPKAPRVDARLEPLKAVLEGRTALLINVERADEILACVAACEGFGVKPILVGASDAHKVAGQLVGRVSGVMLAQGIVVSQADKGTTYRTPWADLQNAGLRVAFYSSAEEGAVDLPLLATYAISNGMSPAGALRALTADSADMFLIGNRVGRLQAGLDGDVLLLSGAPFAPGTRVVQAFVNGSAVQ